MKLATTEQMQELDRVAIVERGIPSLCSLSGILALSFPEMPDLLYSLLTQTAIFGAPAGVLLGPLAIVMALRRPRQEGDVLYRRGTAALGVLSLLAGVSGVLFWVVLFWLGSNLY